MGNDIKRILPKVIHITEDYMPNGMHIRLPTIMYIHALKIIMPRALEKTGSLIRFEAQNNLAGMEATDWIPIEVFDSFISFPIKINFINEDVRLLIQNAIPCKNTKVDIFIIGVWNG